MLSYLPLVIKLGVGIIFLVININLMGKSNLAPTSPMDQVQNYVLGGIIGGVIYNDQIGLFQFVLVLLIWTVLVLIVKFVKKHNRFVKRIIDGDPLTVIVNGKLDIKACMKSGISASDLMFKLRAQGVYNTSNVKRAVLEQNGSLTIISYGDENLKLPVISDGQVDVDVLEAIDHDEAWGERQLADQGYSSVRDVYLGEFTGNRLVLVGYLS
jgi:uncharacterized membrane protein YcaP (DUF421 family)